MSRSCRLTRILDALWPARLLAIDSAARCSGRKSNLETRRRDTQSLATTRWRKFSTSQMPSSLPCNPSIKRPGSTRRRGSAERSTTTRLNRPSIGRPSLGPCSRFSPGTPLKEPAPILLLEGRPGVGKTLLAEHAHAIATGHQALSHRRLGIGASIPLRQLPSRRSLRPGRIPLLGAGQLVFIAGENLEIEPGAAGGAMFGAGCTPQPFGLIAAAASSTTT